LEARGCRARTLARSPIHPGAACTAQTTNRTGTVRPRGCLLARIAGTAVRFRHKTCPTKTLPRQSSFQRRSPSWSGQPVGPPVKTLGRLASGMPPLAPPTKPSRARSNQTQTSLRFAGSIRALRKWSCCLSSYIFFTILDFLSQKVKRICQARFSASARVAIPGLASGELHSLGDGHQPAQPSVCGCESAAPPPLFSRARSSSYSIFLNFFL